jgi:hypothetical protein
MNTPSVDVTELSDLDADTLHLVKNGANGFPALLAKSVAGEIQAARSALDPTRRPPIERPRTKKTPKYVREQIRQQVEARHSASATRQRNAAMKNPQKAAAKALRKGLVRKSEVQVQREWFIKGVGDAVLSHIGELERQLAKSGPGQASWGIAYLLNRERARLGRLVKGVPTLDDFAAVGQYLGDMSDHPARTERQRATAAAARAVAGVTDNSVHMGAFASGPRAALADIRDGRGESARLPNTDLPSQVDIHRLEKALSDAKTPSAREAAGYQLTRARLVRGHMLGEL